MKIIKSDAAIQLVYLVAGVETKLRLFEVTERLKTSDEVHLLVDGCGHTGMVADMLPYAVIVADWLETQAAQTFPGVFEYEVTEELGEWIADAEQAGMLTVETFTQQLEILGQKFFNQSFDYNLTEKSCASI